MIEATPGPDVAGLGTTGGAFVNCWINFPHKEGAELLAKHYIGDYGWTPGKVSEWNSVQREQYLDDPETLAFFDEASADGASLVFYEWPSVADDAGETNDNDSEGEARDMTGDEREIRAVIELWLRASADGSIDTLMTLMDEDVVFLRPGQEPMRGRAAFAEAFGAAMKSIRIEGKTDVKEIHVSGDYGYCWNHLTVTMTPIHSGAAMVHAGDILTVFRKMPDGRWVIFRDANMLIPVT